MYAWLWRHLPGPTPVRALVALAMAVAIVAVLFLYVFPWLEPNLPFTDVTVDGETNALSTAFSTAVERTTSL